MATTTQRNKEIVHRFIDAWNEADFEVIDDLVAADARHHDPMDPPDLPRGLAGEKRLLERYQSACPDARLEIEDLLAEGDRVAVRWTATGTHEGEFMGVEPTGNEVTITGFEVTEVGDGEIVESWSLFDALGLLRQLDALPDEL
jgi:steroid delta-isomerase-like uncharacterized protein